MSKVYVCRRCHVPRRADEVAELTHVRSGVVTLCAGSSPDRRCFAHDSFGASEERASAVAEDDDGGDAACERRGHRKVERRAPRIPSPSGALTYKAEGAVKKFSSRRPDTQS